MVAYHEAWYNVCYADDEEKDKGYFFDIFKSFHFCFSNAAKSILWITGFENVFFRNNLAIIKLEEATEKFWQVSC